MCPINTHGLASWLKCFYLSSGVHDNKLTATNLDYNGRFLSSTLNFAQTPSSNATAVCCQLPLGPALRTGTTRIYVL